MDRVQQGFATTVYVRFTRAGIPEDPVPDSASVVVTASDGTTVYSGAAIDVDTPPGEFAYTVTPANAAKLDTLTLRWTGTYDGVAQTATTTVEVVGGFLFTLAQARATSGLNAKNNDGTYKIPTADILAARTVVEQQLEDACGVAFVPRYKLETISFDQPPVLLSRPRVRAIRSLIVNGITYTSDQLAALRPDLASGVLSFGTHNNPWFWDSEPWVRRQATLTVGYEHGYDVGQIPASDVALLLAKRELVGSAADERATSMSTAEETTTFYVPGASEPFDTPKANRFVRRYGQAIGVA